MFQRNFEAYTQGQYASWTAWSVPATMSATDAAKRVGMNEADLRSVNTIPPRMLIKAGSVLIVPRTAKMLDDVTSHVADNGQLSLAPEVVTRSTTVKAGKHETRGQHREALQAQRRAGGRLERRRRFVGLQARPAGCGVPAGQGGRAAGADPRIRQARRARQARCVRVVPKRPVQPKRR